MPHFTIPVTVDGEKFRELVEKAINNALDECVHIGGHDDVPEEDPHYVAETMCWKCGKRWIAAFPCDTLLKELECPGCGEVGHAFITGQDVEKDAY